MHYPAFTLRDYQTETIEAILKSSRKRLLVVLPTGSGKTVVFAHVIQRRPGRTLVLGHRDELLNQAVDKIKLVMPGADLGVVKGDRNELHHQIVVASVQTLARQRRLAQLPKDFSTAIVDEAHHATAESYRRVLQQIGAFDPGGPLTVGFTATPDRGDGCGLHDVFEEIVYERDILTMIRAGYLCDLRAIQIRLDADFNQLHTRRGDFLESEASKLLMEANAPLYTVKAYREHAADKKALVFTPTVELAHKVTSEFSGAGIPAEVLDGSMPTELRRSILARLKSGETRAVVNCAVLTEGFDEPSVDCIIVARPTKSRALYTQMCGRGTRLFPGKEYCQIIDLVGVTTRLDLVTTASLFGVAPASIAKRSVVEAVIEKETTERAKNEREAARAKMVSETVDLFRQRKLHWITADNQTFVLSVGTGLVVLQSVGNQWSVLLKESGQTKALASGLGLEWAQGVAEEYARNVGAKTLVDPKARWRTRPASDRQLQTLKKFRVSWHHGIRAGEASDLISAAIARRCR